MNNRAGQWSASVSREKWARFMYHRRESQSLNYSQKYPPPIPMELIFHFNVQLRRDSFINFFNIIRRDQLEFFFNFLLLNDENSIPLMFQRLEFSNFFFLQFICMDSSFALFSFIEDVEYLRNF